MSPFSLVALPRAAALLALLLCCSLAAPQPAAAADVRLASAETVYVPVYSNVFSAPKAIPFHLATILSIRNTDMSETITVTTADYYDTRGKLLRSYYKQAIRLAPLESTHIYLPEDDTAGGFGANFIVRWKALREINAPIIECVMIGAKSGQGISFVSQGQVIREGSR